MRLLALLLTALFCAAQVPMPYDGARLMPRLSWLGNRNAIPGYGLVGLWDLTGWAGDTQSIPNFAPGQTAALQLGSTAGADTNDPVPGATGMAHTMDDRLESAGLPAINMAANWTLVVVGNFGGTATYRAVAILWANASNLQNLQRLSGGMLRIDSYDGTHATSGALAVPTDAYVALMLRSAGGLLSLTRLDTGVTVTATNRNPTGVPRLGVGAFPSTGSGAVDAQVSSFVVLYNGTLTDVESAALYRWLRDYWAPTKGIVLP